MVFSSIRFLSSKLAAPNFDFSTEKIDEMCKKEYFVLQSLTSSD